LFAVLLGIGLLRGRSYLSYVMGEMLPMRHEGWMVLTKRLTGFFAVLAVGNEIVWRTMSTDAWVKIETFGFPALMFAFLWWQIMALQPHMIDDTKNDDTGAT
jgi:intracellular septation protein